MFPDNGIIIVGKLFFNEILYVSQGGRLFKLITFNQFLGNTEGYVTGNSVIA